MQALMCGCQTSVEILSAGTQLDLLCICTHNAALTGTVALVVTQVQDGMPLHAVPRTAFVGKLCSSIVAS